MHSELTNEPFNLNVAPLLSCVLLVTIFMYFMVWPNFDFKNGGRRKLPPGPIGIPIFGAVPFLGTEPHKTFIKWKKKYGDIIGLYLGTKYTVVISEYSLAKEIYKSHDSLGRTIEYFKHFPQIGFLTANGEAWTEQRRFCMSVSKELGIGRKTWGDMATEEARNFVEFLREFKGKPVEIENSLRKSLISNILYFILGRKFDRHKDADIIQMTCDLARIAFTVNGTADIAFAVPGLWKVLKALNIGKYGELKIMDKYSKFLQKEISKYDASKSNNAANILSTYMEEIIKLRSSGNNSHHFSKEMLEGNMVTILTATIDTTTASVCWLIRLMSEHQDVQSRIYKEVMEVLGKDGVASYEERQKIPYTFAVLMEAQRYSSIVPLTSPRKAIQDIHVRGLTIPKGADMTLNLWALHRDPQYWGQPEEFKPERFLDETGEKLVTSTRSFLPFSTGRRNCPGELIAWRQNLAYFTEIIKHFQISTPPGEKTHYKITKGLVTNLEHQKLCFNERKD